MSPDPHNPPPPGEGITPQESPANSWPEFNQVSPPYPPSLKSAEPHFNEAAREQVKPSQPTQLTHEHPAPDGTVRRAGPAEDARQQAMKNRVLAAYNAGISRQAESKSPSLSDEFRNANERGR